MIDDLPEHSSGHASHRTTIATVVFLGILLLTAAGFFLYYGEKYDFLPSWMIDRHAFFKPKTTIEIHHRHDGRRMKLDTALATSLHRQLGELGGRIKKITIVVNDTPNSNVIAQDTPPFVYTLDIRYPDGNVLRTRPRRVTGKDFPKSLAYMADKAQAQYEAYIRDGTLSYEGKAKVINM